MNSSSAQAARQARRALPELTSQTVKAQRRRRGHRRCRPSASCSCRSRRIGHAAAALGHLNALPGRGRRVRTEPLVLQYYDQYFPSLSMMVAAKSLNLGPADIKVAPGRRRVARQLRRSRTDPRSQHVHLLLQATATAGPAFQVDSFYDVLTGKIPADEVRRQDRADRRRPRAGVGSTLGDAGRRARWPPVLTLAHSVSSILQEHFFVAPAWGYWTRAGAVYLLVAAYLIALLPRLKAGTGAGHHRRRVRRAARAALRADDVARACGCSSCCRRRCCSSATRAGLQALHRHRARQGEVRRRARPSRTACSASPTRAQGQLDLAWDKFRQVPLSDAVMDNLYNLALDFERKRQFNKAEAVFRYMAELQPEVPRPRAEAVARQAAVRDGDPRRRLGAHPGGTLDPRRRRTARSRCSAATRCEKELGKGAMGVVYLGKDPKIGRVVAIKTMALSQEFEADELAEVKERFFREAETAGPPVAIPNIVTIYDAGEEHDLCYIAMELLKGRRPRAVHQAGQPAAARTRWCRSWRAPPMRSATRTSRASCTATSSPANIMYDAGDRHAEGHRLRHRAAHRLARRPRPAWCSARRPTCRPSSSPGKKIEGRSRPVLARASACTSCSAASCRSRASRWRSSCSRSPNERADRHPACQPGACRRRWSRSSTSALAKNPDAALPDRRANSAARAARRDAAARRRERRTAAAWTSSSERRNEPTARSSKSRAAPTRAWCARTTRTRSPPTRRTAWWCSPTAWAATTRARWRAAWRPR